MCGCVVMIEKHQFLWGPAKVWKLVARHSRREFVTGTSFFFFCWEVSLSLVNGNIDVFDFGICLITLMDRKPRCCFCFHLQR